jgi:putative ABC transport system substrate-binding protein
MKLVGLFMNLAEADSDIEGRKDAFKRGLTGFTEGHNVRLDYRYGAGDFPNYRRLAKQLISLRNEGRPPDVIFSGCGPSWRALEAEMATAGVDIPVVFAGMIDPIPTATHSPSEDDTATPPLEGSHVVTGFISYRSNLCRKWPALLKRMRPQLTRAAILFDPGAPLSDTDSRRQLGGTQLQAIKEAAAAVPLDVSTPPIDVTASRREIERKVKDFADAGPGKSGLIVPGATLAATCREFITRLAIDYKLPAIYPNRMYTKSGGLMSYGAKTLKLYESAAERVARLLNGREVEGPTHRADFELVINRDAAVAIGIDQIPQDLLNEATP